MGKSEQLYKQAKKVIPGGTQLLSKRQEMFVPGVWPAYYDRAEGCEVWDLDGTRYIDASFMGIGACILGYTDGDVDAAVREAVRKGAMSTLNCPEEVELAQLLCSIHPWAEMARFARTGGEAMTIAVRLARAKTGKEIILFCGYHGWHDWYLSANIAEDTALDGHLLPGLEPRGVPRGLRGTAVPFNYNDIQGLLKLVKENENKIAAIVMEPVRNYYPDEGFLEAVRDVAQKQQAALIFDEITSGWRLCKGGAHLEFKVNPDICVFAKGMSNGYSMAAVIGRREVMQAAEETFISSTYWTERIGSAAALASIRKMKTHNIPAHLVETGRNVQEGWRKLAKKHGLNITVSGIYPLSHFTFDYKEGMVLKTIFTEKMLEKGFLATTSFYASYAHKDGHIDGYLNAVEETFSFISRIVKEEDLTKYLKGAVCHCGFRRLT